MKQENFTPVLQLTINGKKFDWSDEYITGKQLKELGRIGDEHPLFLVIEAPWENELILDTTRVNLARPGIEAFISRAKHLDTIILTIETVKGKWENAAFIKTTTIQELINKTVARFGFEQDGNYKLKAKGQDNPLDVHLTIEGAHLKDHAVLVLTDIGKGAGI
ncbi:MAG: multiubiquitin domain-containing protein [Agriterribacter sp.]